MLNLSRAWPKTLPSPRFRKLLMRTPSLLCALLLALPPVGANGAKVYRCPDGSYADKPCGEGARVVTTTRRSSSDNAAHQACVAVGEDAERLARRKAGGTTPAQLLAAVDHEALPFAEKAARRKFVATVTQTPGSPAEVRAVVEGDCVARAEADARAARAAAAKPEPVPTPAPAPKKVAERPPGLGKEQCERLKKDLALLQQQQALMADLDGVVPDARSGSAKTTLPSSLDGLCP
jgi:hypothetical protein